MVKFTGHIFYFLSRFKYGLAIFFGILLIGVLGENSLLKYFKNRYHIEELDAEIKYYEDRYQRDMEQLKAIQRDPDAMTRIARERYFMKKDNEDIFVLSDDNQPTSNIFNDETTE
ncbi:MAG: septum formation initiator family protein [Prevotella sp.]|nr:septum formation initiator family protein [Prevotella sp.]MDD7273746.1 septum formation initiator family protein [Prevotellaceae bacterium]MDY3936067.1 septum formation initiator family protein [Prevotella sp.]